MGVIITGAAGVLGQSVVERFTQDGHKVACIDRVQGPSGANREWFIVRDLAEGEDTRTQMIKAAEWTGSLDALVLLVGAFKWQRFEDSTLDDWRSLFSANVETAFSAIQAALPYLRQSAAIVTVGAASAEPAGAGMAPYAVAKSGVARLSEALAQELKPRGIRVNSVLPAIIDTPRNRADMPEADFSEWTSPDAIADAIAFLASHASRAVNGASLDVSNGQGQDNETTRY